MRTVVSIKPASPPAPDLTRRPGPVRSAVATAAEVRPTPPVVQAPEPEPARSPAPQPAERLRSRRFMLPPMELLSPADNPFRSTRLT